MIIRAQVLIQLHRISDGHTPVVDSADGSYDYQARASILSWRIPLINAENKEGTMEFSIPYRGDSSGFFPVGVKFQSSTLYTGIEVSQSLLYFLRN